MLESVTLAGPEAASQNRINLVKSLPFLGFTWLVSQRSLQVFLGERFGCVFRFM